MCVQCTVHNCLLLNTIQHRTNLIIFPLLSRQSSLLRWCLFERSGDNWQEMKSGCCHSVVFTCSFLSVFIFFVVLWRFWLVIGSSVLTNSSLMHDDDDLSIICHTHVNHLLRTTTTCQSPVTHTSITCHTRWRPVNHLSHTRQSPVTHDDDLSIISHTRQSPITDDDDLSIICHTHVNHLSQTIMTHQWPVTHDDDLSMICHTRQSPVPHDDDLSIICHTCQSHLSLTTSSGRRITSVFHQATQAS